MKFYYFFVPLVLSRQDPCAFSVIERKFGKSCDKGEFENNWTKHSLEKLKRSMLTLLGSKWGRIWRESGGSRFY